MVLSGLFSKPVKGPGSYSGSDDDEVLPKLNRPSQSQPRRGRVESNLFTYAIITVDSRQGERANERDSFRLEYVYEHIELILDSSE